jgi:adenosylmethionine-8-amino-7-oxononanoate aminotransferase
MTAFLHPFTRPTADDFITIVRGDGALVWDDQGTEYVDGMASLWYCNVGHGRDEIVDAVAAQLRELSSYHTFERFTNRAAEAVCERIAALAPMPDARVFLTCSGSEAVDSAIKLVRLTHELRGDPDRDVIVARTPSYHGVTYGGVTLTGLPANQAHFGPLLPGVEHVAHDDLDAVAALFADHGERIAAVIAEPVIGAGGVLPPADGYLAGLRRLCDEHGALLVLDEVICGFGRLGSWWGGQHYGVEPDLVTFAKGVTSGYQPLGGVLVGRRVREALEADPTTVLRHGHTYSGHPAAAAAALAAIEITERESLLERAVKLGEHLAAGLRGLHDRGAVTEVRGVGAIWAVGLDEGIGAPDVREEMLGRGVIARPIGTSTIAFSPPLVTTDEQLDRCVDALDAALAAVRRRKVPSVTD